jgi:hypothetical protein
MKKLLPFIVALLIVNNVLAQNKNVEASATIENVTVYNSSADLFYKKEIQLPEGKTTIVFTNLSPFIVENTINVFCNNKDVDIVTVTDKINYTKDKKDVSVITTALNDSIKKLTTEIGLLKCKQDAITIEKELLFKGEGIGGLSKGVAVSEIEKASTFFSKRYSELCANFFISSEREKVLNATLNKYKNQLQETSANTSNSSSEIMVTVFNPVAQKVEFSFKYLTDKAGWAPSYDCKFQGVDAPLKFIFRANIFNASGLTWDNVLIKLSTASPTTGFNKPSFSKNNDTKNIKKQNDVAGVTFNEVEVINTIAEFDIKFKYVIPSDAKPYLVDVEALVLPAEFYYYLIPKMETFGFLMAKIPSINKYNLMPGTANIYNNGSFMGKTFLTPYADNDTLNLFLGKDVSLQSTYKENSTSNTSPIIGNYFYEKNNTIITIKSNSNTTLNVMVVDQLPSVDNDDKFKLNTEVTIIQPIVDLTELLLTWNLTIAKKEIKILNYKYEIKSPKNGVGSYKQKKKKYRTISCPTF